MWSALWWLSRALQLVTVTIMTWVNDLYELELEYKKLAHAR